MPRHFWSCTYPLTCASRTHNPPASAPGLFCRPAPLLNLTQATPLTLTATLAQPQLLTLNRFLSPVEALPPATIATCVRENTEPRGITITGGDGPSMPHDSWPPSPTGAGLSPTACNRPTEFIRLNPWPQHRQKVL
eukprot:CAMPEP_0174373960 /NCGR_PEP_ID=MMETSP0811_2-20130205/109130_1 /TAXON_ID=73025 ORGANISM="Eutreptiella gymnastica-like, Strain CCMP1594" /NCGR_SAMPLE_ID=MMETSP0811_2 /ASSEMBLY_ACC=CAM_ASM_000667 /LENGTH=135 /DNA_ID=CAMNT_0015522835 /DNA_START=425 /DNA_END=830 /DNA_ORIENTATION=-